MVGRLEGLKSLSETRLEKKTEDHELSIEGYKIFRNDRDSNGGGVELYDKHSLPASTIKLKSDKLELLSLEIKPTNARSFFLVCWYRPPTTSVDETAFHFIFHFKNSLRRGTLQ